MTMSDRSKITATSLSGNFNQKLLHSAVGVAKSMLESGEKTAPVRAGESSIFVAREKSSINVTMAKISIGEEIFFVGV